MYCITFSPCVHALVQALQPTQGLNVMQYIEMCIRDRCCGGYTVVEGKEFAKKQVDKLMENAKACGAQELITACPLCMYNLTANAEAGLPVHYFTELLAEALGVKEDAE